MPTHTVQKGAYVRKTSKKTPTKKPQLEIGPSLGAFDTSPVRERVRQWQAQGGGVITAEDIFVEPDDDKEKDRKAGRETKRKTSRSPAKASTPKPGQHASNQSESDTSRKNGGRTKERVDREGRHEHRSVSAPRKRIISDGHWRKNRSPPRESSSHGKDEAPYTKSAWQDDGIRVRAMPDPSPAKARRHREMDLSKQPMPTYDDGIRVYSTSPRSRGRSEQLIPNDGDLSVCGSVASDAAEGCSRASIPRTSRSFSSRNSREYIPDLSVGSSVIDSSDEKLGRRRGSSSRRRNQMPDMSPKSGKDGFADKRESHKSAKSRIFSQVLDGSKKFFSKTEPVVIPPPRIPTIESWLNDTPDPLAGSTNDPFQSKNSPFAEEKEEASPEIQLPSRHSSWRDERVSEEMPKETLNTTKESIASVHRSHERELRNRRQINEREYSTGSNRSPLGNPSGSLQSQVLETDDSSTNQSQKIELDERECSPSTLRRRGARRDASASRNRERRKYSPVKANVMPLDEEKSSIVSSVNSASSVEPCEPFTPTKSRPFHSGRPFPSAASHRLATIASVETFNQLKESGPAAMPDIASETSKILRAAANSDTKSEARDGFDPEFLERKSSKNRLTKHSDLISVLSTPRAQSKSIRSARSIRTNRSRLATATLDDLMAELATDEAKYMRELRTLVDGVIPVLLSCVLSKSEAAIAAGLFTSNKSARDDPAVTKPIYDMGIALERLKRAHKRIPLEKSEAFLTWAHGTQNVYRDYLKAWRSGFQDVIVNLAPASEERSAAKPDKDSTIDEGLPRNKDGDVVDSNGERVDVAFLLKRPLVRLKYLAKTLKGIHFLSPSTEAENLAANYQGLIEEARKRSNEERARLEDEAAASIDSTRTRDPRTLGPLTGVVIDDTRSVRARDCFNLALLHTSGQRVDCRVELFLRDKAIGTGGGGDILICEIDGTGRWLLFPPVQTNNISARNGDCEAEIIVMIRGLQAGGREWHELLTLRAEDEETGFEWVQMLGLTPVPPKIMRMQSFLVKSERRKTLTEPAKGADGQAEAGKTTSPAKSRTPSPREMEVPIGEQASGFVRSWVERLECSPNNGPLLPTIPESNERARLQKGKPEDIPGIIPPPRDSAGSKQSNSEGRVGDRFNSPGSNRTPRSLNEALEMAGSPLSSVVRERARRSAKSDITSSTTKERASPRLDASSPSASHSITQSRIRNSPPQEKSVTGEEPIKSNGSPRTTHQRSKSDTPSLELPSIPRVRKDSPPVTPAREPEEGPKWSTPESSPRKANKLSKRRPDSGSESPPPPPPHRSQEPVQLSGATTPDLSTSALKKASRRPSSPLKHEYEPSTATESSSDSETSTVEHNEVSSVSDSSEDEELEDGDAPTPLLPLGALRRHPKVSVPASSYSLPNGTLAPSQSASQAPYKAAALQPNKVAKTIASIFFWSDQGSWEHLHPDECSISVTPGLIEAFEMSSAHSLADQTEAGPNLPSSRASSASTPQPLIGLELTPLVPIRRGTALDISIRSPPTADSKISKISNNNILFRSRSPEECEALYALINYARINNPTYIALQYARSTSFTPQFGGASFHRSASSRGSRTSWFGFGGRSSYRASSAPTPSVVRTDSSIGSMGSAFSALRRFGQKSSRFSISRSTVTSRQGSRSGSIYTGSEDSSGSGAVTPPTGGPAAAAAPLGLSNAKIRLYIRETASKWRDLGAARLTIMRPSDAANPQIASATPRESMEDPSGADLASAAPAPPPAPAAEFANLGTSPNSRQGPNDKRVVVVGKSKGDTLLDVTLGESCFERVARTGIAVSVWESFEGGMVAKEGGVVGGRFRVYMIQMKSEAETAYTFSIVGKLRY